MVVPGMERGTVERISFGWNHRDVIAGSPDGAKRNPGLRVRPVCEAVLESPRDATRSPRISLRSIRATDRTLFRLPIWLGERSCTGLRWHQMKRSWGDGREGC